jgi:capsular exopolysaccharide synthesis family protein
VDLRDYLRILRTRWLLITLCAAVTVALAALLTLNQTPQYTSSSRLFVSTSGASDDSQAAQGGQFSLQRVKSYADLVSGEKIASRVVDRLNLDESPRDLAAQISASSKLDTVILTINVTDPSPERAQRLAQAVSEEFVGYVAELETPPGKDEATIKATIVDAATVPGSPVSPQPVRNIALGLILGVLLGAGVAVLRETLDTTVKSIEDLSDFTDAPLLGGITYDSSAVDEPLITSLGSYAPRVEAFRILRTNLQFIDPDKRHKVFTITSSLPGEGKSTTVTNLAIALAQSGEKVVLVEGDMRRPRVSEYLNLEPGVGLTTVLVGRIALDDAIQTTSVPGLDVLTSGQVPPNPAELIKSKSMTETLAQLRDRYDVVLIDATPLLPVTDAALIASQSDGAIVVIRHGSTTVDQARGAIERLESVGAKALGIVMNRVPKPGKGAGGYGYGYGYGYAPTAEHVHDADSQRV